MKWHRLPVGWSTQADRRAYGAPPRPPTRVRWPRRLLALPLGLSLVLGAARSAVSAEPRLLVYVHTPVRPRALESTLKESLPQVDVTVVGRHRDFKRGLSRSPDAAMAARPVLKSLQLEATLQGVRDGKDEEPYVVMSLGKPVQPAECAELTVGAVDLLGRKATAQFLTDLLGLERHPSVRYVVKADDLLPMLHFGAAQAVVLSEKQAGWMTGRTRLTLKKVTLKKAVGLPGVALLTAGGRERIGPVLRELKPDVNAKLGVDSWR